MGPSEWDKPALQISFRLPLTTRDLFFSDAVMFCAWLSTQANPNVFVPHTPLPTMNSETKQKASATSGPIPNRSPFWDRN